MSQDVAFGGVSTVLTSSSSVMAITVYDVKIIYDDDDDN
jgi:hypothetical protein